MKLFRFLPVMIMKDFFLNSTHVMILGLCRPAPLEMFPICFSDCRRLKLVVLNILYPILNLFFLKVRFFVSLRLVRPVKITKKEKKI